MLGRGKLAIADKSYFLHDRDEKGNLKSKIVEVEKGVEIELIPLADGELSTLTDPKKGYITISTHLVSPKITPDELEKYGKSGKIKRILDKMLEVSGIESR